MITAHFPTRRRNARHDARAASSTTANAMPSFLRSLPSDFHFTRFSRRRSRPRDHLPENSASAIRSVDGVTRVHSRGRRRALPRRENSRGRRGLLSGRKRTRGGAAGRLHMARPQRYDYHKRTRLNGRTCSVIIWIVWILSLRITAACGTIWMRRSRAVLPGAARYGFSPRQKPFRREILFAVRTLGLDLIGETRPPG